MGADAYEKLRVWQDGLAFSKRIYAVTETFPKSEMFGLTSQMRRCAVSVVSNIAEGAARNSAKEFYQFIGISLGSLAELDTQCLIAEGLYIDQETCQELRASIKNIRKMLSGLKIKLKASTQR
jgi:four helix bundle protein